VSEKVHDLIIIGAGPSSLTAAIYTTREDIETILYEKLTVGGLAATTDKIDNYPGFPEGIEGAALADQLEKQAKRFGAVIEYGNVDSIRDESEEKVVVVDGIEHRAKTLLIATGSSNNRLGIPGESEYYGRGVHFCATCDGAFYRDKKIVVVGGGNSAIQESIFLTRFANHIDIIVRSRVKASESLQNDLQKYINDGKITLHIGYTTEEIIATNGKVSSVTIAKDGNKTSIETNGVFIFAGLRPNTAFLENSGVELDELGFVKTNDKLQTNIPGIFCSGDVRSGSTMQIACAVGEGALAAYGIRDYLLELAKKV
jgi:thioredoxin reductase (NADPH)